MNGNDDWLMDDRRISRRYERIEKWALNQTKEDLAQGFASIVLVHMAARKTHRMTNLLSKCAQDAAISAAEAANDARSRYRLAADAANSLAWQVGMARSHRKKGVEKKLANDPKQVAKIRAKELWKEWQEGRRIHENQAAFARNVCEELDLKDASNVEKWCRQWRKEAAGGGGQASSPTSELASPPVNLLARFFEGK